MEFYRGNPCLFWHSTFPTSSELHAQQDKTMQEWELHSHMDTKWSIDGMNHGNHIPMWPMCIVYYRRKHMKRKSIIVFLKITMYSSFPPCLIVLDFWMITKLISAYIDFSPEKNLTISGIYWVLYLLKNSYMKSLWEIDLELLDDMELLLDLCCFWKDLEYDI